MMKEVTAEQILKDMNYKKQFGVRIAISILGVLLILGSILLFSVLGSLAIVLLFFLMLIIVPFGFVPLQKLLQIKRNIHNNRIRIVRDSVMGKKQIGQRYLLMFHDYTGRTEVGIRISDKVYQKAQKGDEFFLVYADAGSRPVAIYPIDEYYFVNVSMSDNSSKKEITEELILKDAGFKREYVARTFSILLGLGIPMIPVLQIGEINTNTIISVIFLFLIFGLMFGVLFGLKPLISTLRTASKIKQGKIRVVRDRVTSKQYREHYDVRSCLLMFEEHTKNTGKGVFQRGRMYEKVKKGDEFFLVYVGEDVEPILLYPVKEYCYSR